MGSSSARLSQVWPGVDPTWPILRLGASDSGIEFAQTKPTWPRAHIRRRRQSRPRLYEGAPRTQGFVSSAESLPPHLRDGSSRTRGCVETGRNARSLVGCGADARCPALVKFLRLTQPDKTKQAVAPSTPSTPAFLRRRSRPDIDRPGFCTTRQPPSALNTHRRRRKACPEGSHRCLSGRGCVWPLPHCLRHHGVPSVCSMESP